MLTLIPLLIHLTTRVLTKYTIEDSLLVSSDKIVFLSKRIPVQNKLFAYGNAYLSVRVRYKKQTD